MKSKNGNKIRHFRRLLNWTQEDLSKTIGTRQPYLSMYERGLTRTPERLKSRIAACLGIPEKTLFPKGEV